MSEEKNLNNESPLSLLIHRRLSRRQALQYGLSAFLASAMPGLGQAETLKGLIGFKAIDIAHLIDEVIVPEGYDARIFYRWGDPVSDGPSFKIDASNSAQEQLQQAGMHHDALQFFPFPTSLEQEQSNHGLLVMNHEYIDPQLLHADGGFMDSPESYSAEKVKKEQYAHGVSVIEIKKTEDWQIVRPSTYARRITARTAMSVSGPVAGSDFIRTSVDPQGKEILGTLNNCSNGKTPWGTYLTCEENFNGYFQLTTAEMLDERQRELMQRYELGTSYYGWQQHDKRFDLESEPNEANRFGWIVEFDPFDPASKPVKRTALGRFAHENVAHKVAKDNRIAFYSGDDAKFEYIYKFITEKSWDGSLGAHNGQLMDEGILYVAQLNENGSGIWLPLVFGEGKLTSEAGFSDQADVLVHARLAADYLSATPMDRPEWITVNPDSGDVLVSLTNNSSRGQQDKPNAHSANPRANNQFGHIIKITEQDASSTHFNWDVVVLAGDKQSDSTIRGDQYANPDGLMIDKRGVLWVQTDVSSMRLNTGSFAQFGNNQMLAVDLNTQETRRFLTGPIGCEITGVTMTDDQKTMWVNVQHPGEVPSILKQKGVIKSPQHPNAASNWPDKKPNGRPRSATVVITKRDGGVIGT